MENPVIQGRYKIIRQIGGGGFGLTYLAEDLHLPTKPQCVVKRLHPQFPDEKSRQIASRLFQQESEMLFNLGSHPKIPAIIAHFEENGEFFLVQELIEGWTLEQEFAGKKLYDERDAVQLIWQLLETLTFVHSRNVIHRDIKPTNLIRRKSDGSVFLIDFGAVKQVGVNPLNQSPTFKSTIAIGSNGYMPSEQTMGKPRFASDLYAAGLVTIEGLTGLNPLQLAQSATTGEFVWRHKTRLSDDFANFLAKLVRYDFRQRYNSANEAFSALKMIGSSVGYVRKPIIPIVGNLPISPNPYKINSQPQPNLRPLENQIPQPTIAPPVVVNPNRQSTLIQPVPLPRNVSKPIVENNEKKSSFSNDFALGAGIVGGVLGLFFLAGIMTYVSATFRTTKETPSVAVSNTNIPTANSSKIGPIFQEAKEQASEAETKEKKAKTKSDWEEVGNQYKRAANLSSSVAASSPDYVEAQEKSREYQTKSDNAFYNSNIAAADSPNYPVNSSNSNYTSTAGTTTYTSTTTTTYPTPTPAKPVVTMPAKQSYSTYLAYNILNYDRVEKKVVTTNDSIFSSSVEKQSQNTRDSGVIRINLEGGSYSSARLAFKAPHGQRLTSGNYTNAQEYLWQSPTMYAVSFDKLNCFERGKHSFTINNVIYDELYANILFLDASFTINCDTRRAMGRIRYDAR